MKIVLTNFKCWSSKTIKFDERGLFLLKGRNGKGKSTILEAVYYALYGDVKKPCSFGTTTCSVVLELNDFVIKRSTRPNRLIVKYESREYEDEVAQKLIDNHFMNSYEFLASTYIRQNRDSSILKMTPTEMLNFLKNISYDPEVTNNIKEKIKNLLKEVNIDIVKKQTIINELERQIQTFDNVSTHKCPVDDEYLFNNKLKECEENIQKHQELKTKIVQRLGEFDMSSFEKKKDLKKEIEQLQCEIVEIDPIKIKSELKVVNDQIEQYLVNDIYLDYEYQLETLLDEYDESIFVYNDISTLIHTLDINPEIVNTKIEKLTVDELLCLLKERLPKGGSTVMKKINELRKRLSNLSYDENLEDVDIVELRESKKRLEYDLKRSKNNDFLTKRIKEKSKELENIVDIDTDLIDELNKKHKTVCSNLEKLLTQNKNLMNIKLKLRDYKNYLKLVSIQDEIKKHKHVLVELETRQKKLILLRDKSNEAEVLALQTTIDTINLLAQTYLDTMFSEPITLKIENYKEGAKGVISPKLNVFLYHKDNEYDTVDQLSGGERQKCELAFQLAINQMMKSPMLLLDECINNLDSEFNHEILGMLKTISEKKLVILISHECTQGIFDKIFNLEQN